MVEHRDKAKGSLAELSSAIVYQLVLNPWRKFPSWAGLELAILLPQPKFWDYSRHHLAKFDSLISIFFFLKKTRSVALLV